MNVRHTNQNAVNWTHDVVCDKRSVTKSDGTITSNTLPPLIRSGDSSSSSNSSSNKSCALCLLYDMFILCEYGLMHTNFEFWIQVFIIIMIYYVNGIDVRTFWLSIMLHMIIPYIFLKVQFVARILKMLLHFMLDVWRNYFSEANLGVYKLRDSKHDKANSIPLKCIREAFEVHSS